MPILGVPEGVPSGSISIWTGLLASIPVGWKLCDGTFGTPDLRNVYPKCVPTVGTDPGATGGESTVTLTEAQMDNHKHTFSISNHEHDGADNDVQGIGGPTFPNIVQTGQSFGINDLELDISSTHFVGAINNAGSDSPHNNLPKSKEVLYIQKS